MAFRQFVLVILIVGEDRNGALQHRLAYRAEIALRQGEHHRAWLDLRQDRQRIDVVGMDDVADIDLAEADDAVDRRHDGRIIELRLRRLDGGLIGIDGRLRLVDLGLLGVEVLEGLEVLLHQRLETRQVLLGVDQLRLVLALFRHRLIERRLQRRRIDLGEDVAFVDLLALAEVD